jgi:hypothetical protein
LLLSFAINFNLSRYTKAAAEEDEDELLSVSASFNTLSLVHRDEAGGLLKTNTRLMLSPLLLLRASVLAFTRKVSYAGTFDLGSSACSSTDVECPLPPTRIRMSIHTQGKSCSDLGRVLVFL